MDICNKIMLLIILFSKIFAEVTEDFPKTDEGIIKLTEKNF